MNIGTFYKTEQSRTEIYYDLDMYSLSSYDKYIYKEKKCIVMKHVHLLRCY